MTLKKLKTVNLIYTIISSVFAVFLVSLYVISTFIVIIGIGVAAGSGGVSTLKYQSFTENNVEIDEREKPTIIIESIDFANERVCYSIEFKTVAINTTDITMNDLYYEVYINDNKIEYYENYHFTQGFIYCFKIIQVDYVNIIKNDDFKYFRYTDSFTFNGEQYNLNIELSNEVQSSYHLEEENKIVVLSSSTGEYKPLLENISTIVLAKKLTAVAKIYFPIYAILETAYIIFRIVLWRRSKEKEEKNDILE